MPSAPTARDEADTKCLSADARRRISWELEPRRAGAALTAQDALVQRLVRSARWLDQNARAATGGKRGKAGGVDDELTGLEAEQSAQLP